MSHNTEVSEPTREGTFRAFIGEFWKPVLVIIVLIWGYVYFSAPIRVYPNGHPVPEEAPDRPVPTQSAT